ncbi:hypothetical protein AQUCO_04100124v1 [Aquilegia coerulea]|uniref:RNA helicase n=1 Tax=Aquilegia coerulea TaxID=218851 RepID=A0A2G5CQ79_AQUCA|nr:hypothetical protein AQUCO_04100124v1 [Aquilegia coerulea]
MKDHHHHHHHHHQSLNSSSTTLYIPPHQRLKSIIVSSSSQTSIQSSSSVSTPSLEFNWKQNHNNFTSKPRNTSSNSNSSSSFSHYQQPPLQQQQQHQQQQQQKNNLLDYNHTSELINRSDVQPDFDVDTSSSLMEISNFDGLDEWKRKLTLLIRSKNEQEVVSKDKRDRNNFEQIANLATKMGLYSHLYARVFVISKVPLPNYRFDLDDKRPQREVVIQFGLQRRVETLLSEYISKEPTRGTLSDGFFSRSSSTGSLSGYEGFFEQQEPQTSAVMEKILRRRSLHLLDQQQAWKESEEGEKMQRFRRGLPSYKERDVLLKTISRNQVVVITGETGCGKTTQIPQYILEAEIEAGRGSNCSIICTQPRRISAMAVSERVAAERGENLGESVGYRVRLEGIKGRDTRLLFCTTGILLRRLLVDRNLKGVSYVIVDEIHERGMNEDFLLIVLKEILPHRPELRLILMSATLNADQFSSYFGGAPMVHIPGFTYPVRTHFLEDVLEMTGYRLTPSNQTDDYGQDKSWKKQTLRKRKSQIAFVVEDALEVANLKEYSSQTQNSLSCWNPDSIGFNLIENVLCHLCNNEKPGAILVFMTGWDDINSLKDQLQAHPLLGDPSRVLLLACHGSMASSEQSDLSFMSEVQYHKVPFICDECAMRTMLSTNIAETSITIDDVVFVIDCGKAKETSYDALNNTPCLLPSWISKAAAGQRRGRAGRVQPGECFRLYPKCVYDAFADNQLPELLRTPLQSICLQIKSLQLGSISDFLSRALQSPKLLSVQNAIEYLKIIGALDEEEKLTILGRHLSMLPVEPKLGKMLIMGAIFNCLDPILTVVAGLSVRDPFLMPIDKKDLAEQAKSQFAARDYSDHLAIIRAYEGWKDAEKEQSGYDYCWKNFLSAPTLKAIDSLRKEFFSLLKDTGLVDDDPNVYNGWSNDGALIRAVICTGLYPGICSVVNKETSVSLKTMEDGRVLLYSNSVNGRESNIPYPWLVFNEKIKVNSVLLRDSTAISDSVLLLFGGKVSIGEVDGHLKMLGGYLEFFMKPSLAETYMNLKRELEQLIQSKLLNPKMNIQAHGELLSAVQLLISEDQCDGKFVFGHQVLTSSNVTAASVVTAPSPAGTISRNGSGPGGDNSKSQLQTLVTRAGHEAPTYKTEQVRNSQFQATVVFNGMQFVGQPCSNKKLAEKDAAAEALQWLTRRLQAGPVDIDRMSMLLKQKRKLHH